jgi:hypothetical protein
MGGYQLFKYKKLYSISLLVVLTGFVFAFNIPSALAAGGCEENNGNFQMVSLSSIFNPLLDFAEKAAKGFGYEVSLAAAPDPDFCGSDSVACDGSTPTATISWEPAPDPLCYLPSPGEGGPVSVSLCNYLLTVGTNNYTVAKSQTSYAISSGLVNNTTYNWSVEAYYEAYYFGYSFSCPFYATPSANHPHCGQYTNQPYGSFTTPDCAPPPPPAPCPVCDKAQSVARYRITYDSESFEVDSPQITVTWNALGYGHYTLPSFNLNGVVQQWDGNPGSYSSFTANLQLGNNTLYMQSNNGQCDACGCLCDGVWAKITFANGKNLYTGPTWSGTNLQICSGKTYEGAPYLNTVACGDCCETRVQKIINVQPIVSNSEMCADGVTLPSCLNPSASETRLNWSYLFDTYNQKEFQIMVDNNSDFSSPEVNPGWISSANKYYNVSGSLLQPNASYYWKAQVKNTNDETIGWSCAADSFITPGLCSVAPLPPGGSSAISPPTQLIGDPIGCSAVQLSWTDNSNNEDGFKIERKTGAAGFWAEIDTTGYNVVTYIDGNLSEGTEYYYRVRAYNSSGNSDYSNAVNVTTCLSSPPPNFTLNKDKDIYATLAMGQGGESTSAKITVTSLNGFSSPINLSAESVTAEGSSPALPADSRFCFDGNCVALGAVGDTLTSSEYSTGSQFKVNIGSGLTSNGAYAITIRGENGGLVNKVVVYLNVQIKNPAWQEF